MTVAKDKNEEILTAAENLFAKRPDWVTFYRELLGLRGLVRRFYPNLEMMADFEQSETYREIQRMLTDLRKQNPPKEGDEDLRVITVRSPKSLHDALRIEAYEHHTSMNKLCISKLLQFIDIENVPSALEEKKVEAGL